VRTLDRWKQRARSFRREIYALYLACRDPRTPWYAKTMAAVVVAYAASPIDLIPDFVPVLGYVDDLLLLPLGIWLAIRLVPAHVMAESREQAAVQMDRPTSRAAAVVIVGIWFLAVGVALFLLADALNVRLGLGSFSAV